jgi:hypothetical protein
MLPTKTIFTSLARWSVCLLWLGACSPDSGKGASQPQNARSSQAGAGFFPTAGGGAIGATPGVAGGGALGSTIPGLLPPPDPSTAGATSGCRNATIGFLIDGSGSMCEPFGGATRWTALRTALLDKTNGLIYKVNNLATIGMYLYDGSIDLMLSMQATAAAPPSTCMSPGTLRRLNMGECPQIVEVAPAPMNAAKIDAKYPATELGGSTPTDKAMTYVVDALIKARKPGQDLMSNPQYIILATDGQPNDICTNGTGGDGTAQQMGVIAAVDKAAQMGITTFVISLASDAALQAQLDVVAKHGNLADPMAHTFSPMNPQDLTMTLSKLLSGALGCLF